MADIVTAPCRIIMGVNYQSSTLVHCTMERRIEPQDEIGMYDELVRWFGEATEQALRELVAKARAARAG